ncbi:unnamed protein product, partial [Mesorhabditis spiculigera]
MDTQYTIEPVPGYEFLQRTAPDLPSHASRYNGKPLTLNERFGIYARGYLIHAIETESDERHERLVKTKTITKTK